MSSQIPSETAPKHYTKNRTLTNHADTTPTPLDLCDKHGDVVRPTEVHIQISNTSDQLRKSPITPTSRSNTSIIQILVALRGMVKIIGQVKVTSKPFCVVWFEITDD